VWRQLRRRHLDHNNPEVAEKARICLVCHAAALWQRDGRLNATAAHAGSLAKVAAIIAMVLASNT
jgi:hypothetical protein